MHKYYIIEIIEIYYMIEMMDTKWTAATLGKGMEEVGSKGTQEARLYAKSEYASLVNIKPCSSSSMSFYNKQNDY